ncbi:MAG: hypothetical protein E7515_06045 [Ruminococcaceae bacterium]|jgi:hypothetical protein|nr:hypothetical protein [Oscillospiraceae bacterium]
MKRFFAVLTVVSILLMSLVVVSSAASPKITMKTGETSNGQTEVIITVSKGSDLATFQAALNYETDKVKLSSVEYLSGDKNVSNTETEGVALLNDVWVESINDKTDIIRLVFSGNADTKTTFSLEDIIATDSNDEYIDFDQPVTVKTKVKANTPEAATDPAANNSSSNSGNGISGSTNGTSPNTGRMIASAAGICGAATAAAAVVIILKKKSKTEE